MKLRHLAITGLLLVACALAALLSLEQLSVTRVDDALLALQTHRFGRTTKSRLNVYFKTHQPDHALEWTPTPQGMGAPVLIELKVGSEAYRFEVDGEAITAKDPATEALVEALLAADAP